jgi:hypothetical protein
VLEEAKPKKVSWSDETDIRNELFTIKSQLAQLLSIVEELRGANKNEATEESPLETL